MNNANQKMPRVTPMPAPPLRPAPLEYDDEVLRVAQKQLEQTRAIATLESDRDEWRRRCQSAEGECRRLEARLAQQADDAERRFEKIAHDLDYWKSECVRVEAILHAGSRVFLQALEHKRTDRPDDETAAKAGLAAVANEIEAGGDDPLPRIVAAGPADDTKPF